MPGKTVNFDVVRKLALGLPGVEGSTLHGAPSLKVGGKLLACPAIHKTAEPGSLAVRLSFEQRAKLIGAEPGVYYVTEHYLKHPVVLVRLSRVRQEALRKLLGSAWLFVTGGKRRGGGKQRKREAPMEG